MKHGIALFTGLTLFAAGCGSDPEPISNDEAMGRLESYFPEARDVGLGAYQELALSLCTNWRLAKNSDIDAEEHYQTASGLNTGAFSAVEYDALMSISIQWQCPELSDYALGAIENG